MGCFPSGVTVVTTSKEDGSLCGLTATSVCSVSLDPPLLLVCVDESSDSLSVLRGSRAFTVYFLASGAEEVANLFALKGEEKAAAIRANLVSDLLAHAVAFAECEVTHELQAGDHTIFVGCVHRGGKLPGEKQPLVFRRGTYRTWPLDESGDRIGTGRRTA